MNRAIPFGQAVVLCGLLLGPVAMAGGEFPKITVDGPQKMKDTNLGLVYAEPGADLGIYRKIWLADAGVSFKKRWQKNQNRSDRFRVRDKDMERMRSELAGLFREVFSEELTGGGYTLVGQAGEDVLLVRPAIVNLDIVAPDTSTPMQVYRYSESAGEMTLYLELCDSVTGDIIARAMDRKEDREHGYLEWQTRVTNRAAAKRILKSWAATLREALDEARGMAGQD